ncbi:hypothetical protein Kpol_1003p1 [Vanderwaltozyma polyspora DSM 70294]|uniref:lysine--tRNA ligase n=1 Tax=Vanderwaltozyma polyspora (strain ATCC 22028 / DSM 70294 / BCRC 21397 / CBS 2163 / NBRC 10782 / NRRL Y-8283 / UCD 57-17) TaxID=436907 RepID=A7TLV9_VANPO|nr:uncharacterized protein Kpol_1003p1 [Vanderwaltozyma polyspora DSM 70294]EDO16696.1 hypothetical protein Kpol_1003p1 [Vanderwaltozyma polyspora DSM 70294]
MLKKTVVSKYTASYTIKRLLSNNASKKIIIDPSTVEFTKRNDSILKNLNLFYPSMTDINNNTNNSNIGIKAKSINQFQLDYSNINEDSTNDIVSINGRIKNIRYSGKKICFIDLYDSNRNDQVLQLIINFNIISKFNQNNLTNEIFTKNINLYKVGDYIHSIGYPGLSQSHQKNLSLKCNQLPKFLSTAQLPLPPKLADHNKIKNNRVVDYQVNGVSSLILRSFIIKQIRSFLDIQNFIEVETPILSNKSNGAHATPFETKLSSMKHDPLQSNLFLRISPELWLKRLIVSGLDRVYEIGKVFRNEGIDQTHNPEFTTLEFYQSYASLEDLINQSQDLFKFILLNLNDSKLIHGDAKEVTSKLINELSNNNWKFNRVDFLPTLTKEINNGIDYTKFDLNDSISLLNSIPSDARNKILPASSEEGFKISSQQILDKLSSYYIESRYCNSLLPTLIYHHPTVMSPLAKSNPANPIISKRFELYINGKEYINAYEEENCPQEQEQKFLNQKFVNENFNDTEALSIDSQYIEAMKWGMPPIGGLGLGIDRLCMLLLNKQRIDEVLSFGCIDAVNRQ